MHRAVILCLGIFAGITVVELVAKWRSIPNEFSAAREEARRGASEGISVGPQEDDDETEMEDASNEQSKEPPPLSQPAVTVPSIPSLGILGGNAAPVGMFGGLGASFNGGSFSGGFCGSLGAVGGAGCAGSIPSPRNDDPAPKKN
jgi:hypothetical protein